MQAADDGIMRGTTHTYHTTTSQQPLRYHTNLTQDLLNSIVNE